ncbi:hypothetical protein M0R45_005216 [Rubus argutus]|uniref:Uncharacterized protein n=1 Tax=Rubus argutus TaxID=59490 RepID=A0AAW1YMJ2_RUBAR
MRSDSIGKFWRVIEEMRAAGRELGLDTSIKDSRQFQKSKMMEDGLGIDNWKYMVWVSIGFSTCIDIWK